jgi:hypothetical protein
VSEVAVQATRGRKRRASEAEEFIFYKVSGYSPKEIR